MWLLLIINSHNTVLNSMVSLKRLDVSKNRIREISPLEVSGIIKLQHLDVSYNRLTDNAFIAELVGLIVLDLSHNNIVELSRDIDALENLQVCCCDLCVMCAVFFF